MQDKYPLVERLKKRIAKLEARLEIDRCYIVGAGDELVPRIIPEDERDSFPDGIDARDETIKLQDEVIKEQETVITALAEALEPFAKYGTLFAQNGKFSASEDDAVWMSCGKLQFIAGDFRRARKAHSMVTGTGGEHG